MSVTPETDAFFAEWTRTDGVLARSRLHAEKLERERDEAREALAEEIKFHHRTHAELVQTQCQMQDVIRERDEAIVDRDIARLAALDSDKAHDRMVGELEKVYDERDEAREKLCKVLQILDDYDQAIKNPSSPFWEAFKKWFTWEVAK